MIDIKFLRENPEVVKENIRKKYQDEKLPLVDEVIALDTESRKAKQEADDLRASRNRISKEIGALMGQGKKEEAEAKKIGLAAPQVTYIMNDLKNAGFDVDVSAITIEEAKTSILKALGKK